MQTAARPTDRSAARVLSRALVRASHLVGLPQKSVAAMLGVSEATVSRLRRGREIDPGSKEGELATLFLRLYRSLDALVGGDEARARKWMQAHNLHLNGTPADMVRSVGGLVHVVEYLDAMRGKS